MVRSCMGCVPPKRHPGCHGQCKEYLEQKAEYDRLKAIDYQKRHTIGVRLRMPHKHGIGGQKMDNKGKFKPGTRFRGNGNGALFEVIKVDKHNATLMSLNTGNVLTYGIRALEKCDVTILEDAEDGK